MVERSQAGRRIPATTTSDDIARALLPRTEIEAGFVLKTCVQAQFVA